jgi:drug/metabolite transporter (DMT)-like permease
MAIIFLGERLAPYHLIGAALVAGGIGLASLRITSRVLNTTPRTQQPRPGHAAGQAK